MSIKRIATTALFVTLYQIPATTLTFGADPCPNNQCDTAIGKINVAGPQDIILNIFRFVLVIASFGAIFLLIIAGYNLLISAGNKEKVSAAREMITSTIMGLLFIILSIVILQVIGVDILRIPQFKP